MNDPCPWRREQVRADHGQLSHYGRQCMWERHHVGPHEVPIRAKQSNAGVWYNPETGETITQNPGGIL